MDFLSNALRLFVKGGIVMYPLLLCSIFVIAIAIERWAYYKQMDTDVEALLKKVKNAFNDNIDKHQIQHICEQAGGPVGMMIAAGLSYPGNNRSFVKEAMEEAALNQITQLKARLNYLDTIVTLSPLLGLLGTVTGMINSFSVLNVSSGKPFAITGGVAEALVATATGLGVAIIALLIYSCFTSKVDYFIYQMEKSATRFLNFLPWEGESK